MKTSTLKSAITIMTITTSLWSVLASAEDCDLKRGNKTYLAAAAQAMGQMKVAMLDRKDAATSVFELKLVASDDDKVYSAILDVHHSDSENHIQLWAINQCLAVGPRHAIADSDTHIDNSVIMNEKITAKVGYKNSKEGFDQETRTLTPVICGSNNHSQGSSSEDICIYKATKKFPASVNPIKISNMNGIGAIATNNGSNFEGVGFTNDSNKLANSQYGLGSSRVHIKKYAHTDNYITVANFIGYSGSALIYNNQNTGRKELAGFKVGPNNIVNGSKIYDLVKSQSQLNPRSFDCP